jgi:hypothetical protein
MSSLTTNIEQIRVCDAVLAADCSDYYCHPNFAQLRAAIAQAVEAAAPKPAKAPKAIGALAFWAAHGEAVASIIRRYGPGWKCKAPPGQTVLATLSPGLRSCKSQRGTLLRWGKDHRLPTPAYWPGGTLPVGVTVEADYPRHDPNNTVPHDAQWHIQHGYIWDPVTADFVNDLAYRSAQSHRDSVDAYHAAAAQRMAA